MAPFDRSYTTFYWAATYFRLCKQCIRRVFNYLRIFGTKNDLACVVHVFQSKYHAQSVYDTLIKLCPNGGHEPARRSCEKSTNH